MVPIPYHHGRNEFCLGKEESHGIRPTGGQRSRVRRPERELAVTRTVLESTAREALPVEAACEVDESGRLALHVADLPGWMLATIGSDELDAANAPRPPADLSSQSELLV